MMGTLSWLPGRWADFYGWARSPEGTPYWYDRDFPGLGALVSPRSTGQGQAGDRFWEALAVEDSSGESYQDQLAYQIKWAVAHGDLESGARLPPIRSLAEKLDLAPGTIARVFRTLEAEGVIYTDGARGIRVAFREGAERRPEEKRLEQLNELLRPAAVAAFHLGASAEELFTSLEIVLSESALAADVKRA